MLIRWLAKLWTRSRKTFRRWQENDGNLLAASMAYYTALSFFPLVLILVAVLGFVLQFSSSAQDAQGELLKLIAHTTTPELAMRVGDLLGDIRNKAFIGGPLGLVTLLFASIGIFCQLEVAFGRIWNLEKVPAQGILQAIRNTLFHRLRAFLMLVATGFLVVVSFIASLAVSALQPYMATMPGGNWFWSLGHVVASLIINGLLFTVIYKVVPRTPIRWAEASRGGLVAAVLWECCRQVLAVWLLGRRYTAYGVVGSLIILMLWVYIASSVVFLGAEYIRVVEEENTP